MHLTLYGSDGVNNAAKINYAFTHERSKLRSVWPTLFLLNVFAALEGTHFYILFVVTAAGVVLCGSPKKRPLTSSIVQFIFYFWSFEISRNILKNQKIS